MQHDENIIYMQAQIVSAYARIEGMKAENMQRKALGQSVAYTEQDFVNIIEEYGLSHNQVISHFYPA